MLAPHMPSSPTDGFGEQRLWLWVTDSVHLWIPVPCYHFYLICPAMQGDYSLGQRKTMKQLLEEDVDRFSHSLPYSCCPHGLSTPHFPQGNLSLTGKEVLEKRSRGGEEIQCGGSPPKNSLVSRLRWYFLHAPQQNFLWISDHPLFPITLLFTLSIWRIQMLNDKRGRRRREGGEEFHFAWRRRYWNATPHSISEAFINVAEAGSIIFVSDDYLRA